MARRRIPPEAPRSTLDSLLTHATFSITFLLAEAVAVRTRILGRTGGLLCQPCFRLRVKRTAETGGGGLRSRTPPDGPHKTTQVVNANETYPHVAFLARSKFQF